MASLELFPIGSSFLLIKFIPFISLHKLHNNLVFDLPYISEGELRLANWPPHLYHTFKPEAWGKKRLEKVYHHSSTWSKWSMEWFHEKQNWLCSVSITACGMVKRSKAHYHNYTKNIWICRRNSYSLGLNNDNIQKYEFETKNKRQNQKLMLAKKEI